MKKIAVIVNKNWETEAVFSALVSVGLRPRDLPFPTHLHIPAYGERTKTPRLVFVFKDETANVMEVTLWCLQDLMFWDKKPDPKTQHSSSSEEKYRVLPAVLREYDPDLVISVSTAGYPGDFGCNGSVILGACFFLHYGREDNELSTFKHNNVGKLLESNVNDRLFTLFDNEFKNKVEPKFLPVPRGAVAHPCCIASKVFAALSVVNITDYAEYNWADRDAQAQFKQKVPQNPCMSSETTHGVVKLCTEKPILFLSPITDQFGLFDFEVTPTQNFAASFNGGIVLAQLLCDLPAYITSGSIFSLDK